MSEVGLTPPPGPAKRSSSTGQRGLRRQVVRERIDPRLTASLFSNYRSALDAVLELTDNAVDSRLQGRRLELDITARPGTLIVTAIGGAGMGPREIERDYLRWGASRKKAGEQIGRYGQGGKAAIGHLGERVEIAASPAGDPRAYALDDPAYRDRSRLRTYELRERSKPVDADLGYVRIEVGGVDRRIDARRLAARAAEVYRPLLVAGHLALRVNHGPVSPPAWPVAERREVAVRAGGRLLRGWYGLLSDPPPPGIEPGVRVYHLGRLVGAPDFFGHPGPAVHPAMGRLVGEIELPHVALTLNKSDVERDSDAWLAVEARMHRLLAPLVRRLTRDQGAQANPQALRTAEQVRRILARALRLLEAGQLFESETGGGAGSGDQLTLEQAAGGQAVANETGEEAAESPHMEPPEAVSAQPPPLRTSGRQGGNRRGVAEIVIRALDPRLRSALVVEDGVRRVVINSRFPLYEVRKGDLWYQLETALREVCVTIPEATIPEFERKVNELMLVSLALAKRRRRRRSSASAQTRSVWESRA